MKLIAVTDDRQSIENLAARIISIKDSIDFVQIREKSKSVREMITLLDLLHAGDVRKEKIIINDRLDVALLKDIPNLQLPEHGLPVKMVKQRYPELQVGCSVHSYHKAKEAEQDGADYVLYGHCFATNSKKGVPPNGLDPVLQMKKELQIPVYAIGGITLDNITLMKQVKTDGIAVMSSIFQADDPYLVTKKFCEAIHDETKV